MSKVNTAEQVTKEVLPSGLALEDIPAYAKRYMERTRREILKLEEWMMNTLAPKVQERGYIEKAEFLHVCSWRSPETRIVCEGNSAHIIEAQTAKALRGTNEAQRMAPLVLLDGVAMPTGSLILHFLHPDPYPVINHRPLWTLGIAEPTALKLKFWQEYTDKAREVAAAAGVDMRTLDRALTAYADEFMPPIG